MWKIKFLLVLFLYSLLQLSFAENKKDICEIKISDKIGNSEENKKRVQVFLKEFKQAIVTKDKKKFIKMILEDGVGYWRTVIPKEKLIKYFTSYDFNDMENLLQDEKKGALDEHPAKIIALNLFLNLWSEEMRSWKGVLKTTAFHSPYYWFTKELRCLASLMPLYRDSFGLEIVFSEKDIMYIVLNKRTFKIRAIGWDRNFWP